MSEQEEVLFTHIVPKTDGIIAVQGSVTHTAIQVEVISISSDFGLAVIAAALCIIAIERAIVIWEKILG